MNNTICVWFRRVLDNMGHLAFTRWTNCSIDHLSVFHQAHQTLEIFFLVFTHHADFIFWKI